MAALKVCREEAARPEIMALVALMARDEDGFKGHLIERVGVYKKQYQRSPGSPEGFVYLFGLALCRLALEQGIVVEDGAYLPTRILPNAARGVH